LCRRRINFRPRSRGMSVCVEDFAAAVGELGVDDAGDVGVAEVVEPDLAEAGMRSAVA